VTALERRCRLLLHAYPAWYRRERGEEILATLLQASQPGRSWPAPRDARALITGGLRVRAWRAQNPGMTASLRQAVLAGAALALLWSVSEDLAGQIQGLILAWIHIATFQPHIDPWIAADALTLAAVAAAWFAPWPAIAVLGLAAAAAQEYWSSRIMAIQPAGLLILLAILAPGRNRPPRSWLWLAGALSAAHLLDQATGVRPLLPIYNAIDPTLTVVPWIVLGAAVLWAAIDARPAIAMAVWLASTYLVIALLEHLDQVGDLRPWQWQMPAAGSAILAAAATWRLRRQAAL
jgi:hypothetical protein